MYHNHSQQQRPQSFSNGPRPHQQPHPNQHQNRTSSDIRTQGAGFQFPRPTQLPDELESALAIRGARDMDHRLIDHMNPPSQHQNQGSGSGVSQHANYSSPALAYDCQPGHEQGVNWSTYQTPSELFASPSPSSGVQPQRHPGPQQQSGGSHSGTSLPSWITGAGDSPAPQRQHPLGGNRASGDSQSFYTPESAGSILASFGLSNEDLEVLSHYPDDQLTPDTLPFILRDIQVNKSGKQKSDASSSSSPFSHNVHDLPSQSTPLTHSHSADVPSLLTVTQTAGKVIDYGHASRAQEENSTRETFKREPLSSERTVKMFPVSSSPPPKVDKVERRHVHLEPVEPVKRGDRDYRRANTEHHKNTRSPGREFPPPSKSRNLDRDYRQDRPKPRPSSETRSNDSSRRSPSSTSSSAKPRSSADKTIPNPTMISDFSAAPPKVYPHTCSLCQNQCDQEKDWLDHINTVNHTAACRDLRNKYPTWKPHLPRRSGNYGSHELRESKSSSPSRSAAPYSSPPGSKPRPRGPYEKYYSPHRAPGHHYHPSRPEYGSRLERHHFGLHGSSSSFRGHGPERRESSDPLHRSGLKRPHSDSAKLASSTTGLSSKAGDSSKHGRSDYTTKSGTRGGTGTGTKCTYAKAPPLKKKKKMVAPALQQFPGTDCLVYLTGIPNDASEQEVTDLVGSFGKINNVILMPCSEAESEKGEGQKASVCMMKPEAAQALANSTKLSIRDQDITTSIAKKPEKEEQSSSDVTSSKVVSGLEKGAAGHDEGAEAEHKTPDQKVQVLITGLPESGWSESDIVQLTQHFGMPSDIILAPHIGKVLVSVPGMEMAAEMVKVHSALPAKINNSELEIKQVKQTIGLDTPVALYNLMMMGLDQPFQQRSGNKEIIENKTEDQDGSHPVSWNSLLVIHNVPPSCSSEVQKLVRRFGTVIKTLVVNNTVICEMATNAMAMSVYKRFQAFPCIIQNNPLFFCRRPDPKTKIIAACQEASEDKNSQSAATDEQQTQEHQEDPECPAEETENNSAKSDEKTAATDQTLEEDKGKDETLPTPISDSLTPPDVKLEELMDIDTKETSAVGTADDKNQPEAAEAVAPSKSDDREGENNSPNPPEQESQKMVDSPLIQTNISTTTEKQDSVHTETKQEKETSALKTFTENEEELKKQEERREREARKIKEREHKERDRRTWDREERSRRDREWEDRGRRDRERRDRERRDRERRSRKKPYAEVPSESKSSFRSQREWTETRRRKVEEEEEEFPFNLSDFVTVDEVGDVAGLPVVEMAPGEVPEAAQTTPIEAASEGAQVTPAQAPLVTPVPAESSDSSSASKPADAEISSNLAASASTLMSAQPTSGPEPMPVPTSGPEPMPVPTSGPEPMPVPTSGPEPMPAPTSGPEPTTAPTSGPEPTMAPTSGPEPRTAPTSGPEPTMAPTSGPEPTTTPTSGPEPTTAKTCGPEPTPAPTNGPEPTTAPTSGPESTTAPTSGPESTMAPTCGPVPMTAPTSGPEPTMAPTCRPEPTCGPEPTSEPTCGPERESMPDTENHQRLIPVSASADASGLHPTAVTSQGKDGEKEYASVDICRTEEQQADMDLQKKTEEEEAVVDREMGSPETEESVKKTVQARTPISSCSLPPFDPKKPIGMELLVPKKGFFCKACNRFFTGGKEVEIGHCKTFKHYENLQKYLEKMKTTVTPKPKLS